MKRGSMPQAGAGRLQLVALDALSARFGVTGMQIHAVPTRYERQGHFKICSQFGGGASLAQ